MTSIRVAWLDPPLGPQSHRNRFPLSDIIWGYAGHVEGLDRAFMVSSLDNAKNFKNVVDILIPAKSWHLRNAVTRYLLYRKYQAEIAKLDVNIIHAVDYFSLAIASLGTAAIPVVTTPGSIAERKHYYNPYGRTITKAFEWATATLLSRGAYILATSPYMAHWWKQSGFPDHRIINLPLPTVSNTSLTSTENSRKHLGWRSDQKHLLSAATLKDDNRIDLTISVFSKYMDAYKGSSNMHLHIVGGGTEKQRLYQLAQTKNLDGNVTFYGAVELEELPAFYLAADALIVSRRHNATPRVVQDALCHGLPVIANLTESLKGLPAELDQCISQIDFQSQRSPYLINQALQATNLETAREYTAKVSQSIYGVERVSKQLYDIYQSIVE